MKLTRLFRRWSSDKRKTYDQPPVIDENRTKTSQSSLVREAALLGQERVERQRYYEQWAGRDSWLVRDEALPLLLGDTSITTERGCIEPNDVYADQMQPLWEHLQRCVQQGLPPAIHNPADPPESWRAEPVAIYRWAVAARVAMPAELESLLAFISAAVKREAAQHADTMAGKQTHGEDEAGIQQLAREQVFDAILCLALREILLKKADSADAIRSRILHQLYASSETLFDRPEPPLSRTAICDLLDRSLAKAITK